jgi:rhodanese-related sulfurtransferase
MPSRRSPRGILLRSAVIVAVSSGIAFAVNAARSDSLPLVAESEYEIYDDCPEGEESATEVTLDEVTENPTYFLFIDARAPEEYAAGHIEGALSVPYDPLFPVSPEDVERVRAAAGERTIVVIGDPLTARLLANDLASQGLDWVNYLEESAEWSVLLTAGVR